MSMVVHFAMPDHFAALPRLRRAPIVTLALLLAAAFFLCLPAASAQTAQVPQIERRLIAKPEAMTKIGSYASLRSNCTAGPLPAVRLLEPPAHGRVIVRLLHVNVTNLRQCLFAKLPALIAFYKPAQGYTGTDVVMLQITTESGKTQVQKITIDVTNKSAKDI